MLLPPVARNSRSGSNIFVVNNFSLETMGIGSQDLTMNTFIGSADPRVNPDRPIAQSVLVPKSILTQKLNIAIIIVFTR